MSITEHVSRFAHAIDADPDQSALWQAEAAAGINAIVRRSRRRGCLVRKRK